MVIDVKMCRFENVPWGFRLIGGSDFDVPLTVVKVTEGSIAEQAGLKIDDIIVRINEEATIKLSHNEAHDVISKCGNNFFFGILREGEEPVMQNTENIEIMEEYPEPELRHEIMSPAPEISEEITDVETITNENHEEKLSDDQIAELISGEAEVLKDHNVIGVNFNRIFPKPGVCMSSDVLRQLNDEAIKTKIEREKEKRKWTTFMQKPDRPIPKSKKEIEEERLKQLNSYKVVIKKQPKPRVAPGRTPTPPPIIPEPEPEPEPVIEAPNEELEDESKPLTDDDVPDLEPIDSTNEVSSDDTGNTTIQLDEMALEESQQEEQVPKEETPERAPIIEKTEEELILEQQLADVQKQLMALSSLPSTIQATLDAVTKQLAELLPTFKLQTPVAVVETNEEDKTCEEKDSQCEADYKIEDIDETCREDETTAYVEEKVEDEDETQQKEILHEDNPIEPTDLEQPSEPKVEEMDQAREFVEERKANEELNYKKQKDNGLMEELQQRLIKDRTPKRPARPFGPLVPQQRPLILPGGRRWRTPKDAFNEDFIAETLTSQAELIVGHTLGVNFLKYQKPEKKIDLDKSEVYKVIHHLDRQPKHGIEVRPAKVMAEEDIRNRVQTPISCG